MVATGLVWEIEGMGHSIVRRIVGGTLCDGAWKRMATRLTPFHCVKKRYQIDMIYA